MQRRVPFEAPPIHVRTQLQEIVRYFVVSLVAGDHKTCVSVSVGNFNICKDSKQLITIPGYAIQTSRRTHPRRVTPNI